MDGVPTKLRDHVFDDSDPISVVLTKLLTLDPCWGNGLTKVLPLPGNRLGLGSVREQTIKSFQVLDIFLRAWCSSVAVAMLTPSPA